MTSVAVEPRARGRRAVPAASTRTWYRDGPLHALLAFCAVEIGGLVWWLHVGREQWFLVDEWGFLTGNGFGPHDLLAPYNAHWTTLPILAYRLLFELAGLRSYVPYQLVTIGLHLGTAALLRVVMRRVGVGPWIATLTASLFVFFGVGAQNVLWAFQMTFVGALALGLVHLLLADRDGPFDWRDWTGLAAGLAALMCSDVGVAMVMTVGVATLMRRGWRVAALHTVPLGAIFITWWVACQQWGIYHLGQGSVHPGEVWSFVVTGVGATSGSLVQLPLTAWILGAAFVVGLVLAWVQTPPAERRRRFAIPAALIVGMLAFLVITAIGRAHEGAAHSREGRYLQIQAAMLMPPLAVAADALVRRWRVIVPVVIALFLVGIPGNVDAANRYARSTKPFLAGQPMLESIAWRPLARQVPRALRPSAGYPSTLTIGWLLDAADSGRLPAPRPATPLQDAENDLRLSLMRKPHKARWTCEPLTGPTPVQLQDGEWFAVRGGKVTVTDLAAPGGVPVTLEIGWPGDHAFRVVGRPLDLSFAPTFAGTPVQRCRPAAR